MSKKLLGETGMSCHSWRSQQGRQMSQNLERCLSEQHSHDTMLRKDAESFAESQVILHIEDIWELNCLTRLFHQ